MSLVGDNWTFIHIPRTGGHSLRQMLNIVPCEEVAGWHTSYEELRAMANVPPAFTVIRDPLTWVESCRCYFRTDSLSRLNHPARIMDGPEWTEYLAERCAARDDVMRFQSDMAQGVERVFPFENISRVAKHVRGIVGKGIHFPHQFKCGQHADVDGPYREAIETHFAKDIELWKRQ